MVNCAVVVALFSPLALAFSGTTPIVSWSSQSILDSLTTRLPQNARFTQVLDSFLNHQDICSFDAVVVLEQPDLHASDLRTLPTSSGVRLLFNEAPSSFQFPYARHSAPISLSEYTSTMALKCGFHHTSYALTKGNPVFDTSRKHVIHLKLPRLEGSGSRKSSMLVQDSTISSPLDDLAILFPKHLVLLVGTPSHLHRRQFSASVGNAFGSKTSPTLPSGGILKRYQLLTPGLITALLVTFFVIVPILVIAINALSSIKSPLRAEVPKSFNAQERKNQ